MLPGILTTEYLWGEKEMLNSSTAFDFYVSCPLLERNWHTGDHRSVMHCALCVLQMLDVIMQKSSMLGWP